MNEERLKQVFTEVFELPPGSDASEVRQGETSKWDSLAHVLLVAALESEFDVSLDTADAMSITSYESALALLRERGAR